MSDLVAGSIEEAAQLLSSGDVSAVELAESTLDRVDRLDPEIGAFVTRCEPESVLAEAAASDKRRRDGRDLGPLDGIPIGHKDNVATAGLRTTASSLALEDWIPDHDAAVVTRLRAAGTVLVGKLKNYEFAHSAIDSQHFGRTHNPVDLDRVTGGSSSGSAAALAAGMCLGATGTDTGGSIRIPASFCGVVGLKPTFGLVGRSGVLPSSWSLDHVGPMSRTAGDAALLLSGMVGHDPDDPGSAIGNRWSGPVRLDSLGGVSLGIETTFFNGPTTPGVAAAFQAAIGRLESRGAEVVEVETPSAAASIDACLAIVFPEGTVAHDRYIEQHLGEYGDVLRQTLLAGNLYRAVDYVRAQQVRSMLTDEFGDALERVDAIVTPTMPLVAPRYGQSDVRIGSRDIPVLEAFIKFQVAPNLTGHPAVTVPFGSGEDGMPVGIQFFGRPFDDARLLAIAEVLQSPGAV